MAEVIWILSFLLMGLVSLGFIVRYYLNLAKSKLDAIGLPMTFDNVFFLSANEEHDARERARRQAIEDDLVVSREIVRSELQRQFQDLLKKGISRAEALEMTLLETPDVETRRDSHRRAMAEGIKQ